MNYMDLIDVLPSIIFIFDGKEFHWHPNDYLIWEYKPKNRMIIEKDESFSFGFMPH